MKNTILLILALSLVACQTDSTPAASKSEGALKSECNTADLCNRLRNVSKEVSNVFSATYTDPMDMIHAYQLALVEVGAQTQELGCDCPEEFYEIPSPPDPTPQCP